MLGYQYTPDNHHLKIFEMFKSFQQKKKIHLFLEKN